MDYKQEFEQCKKYQLYGVALLFFWHILSLYFVYNHSILWTVLLMAVFTPACALIMGASDRLKELRKFHRDLD